MSDRTLRAAWPLFGICALAGAATMVVELSAVRLLAPWFGASQVVWTNVIAVILLALAIGYLWGGRQAEQHSSGILLGRLLLGAGCWVAWLPYLGAGLARWLLPAEIGLHEAADLVTWGSLAVALVTFLPPAALLGAVSPLVVQSVAERGEASAGRAGGIVLCISTLGSIVGVFATSHLLLPRIGLQKTFWLAGGMLLAAGLWAHWPHARRAGIEKLAMVILTLACSLVTVDGPALAEGSVELAHLESAYQSLRVVEESSPEQIRILQVNEGFDSFQSVWRAAPGLLPEGYYYNDFLLPLAWGNASPTWRVLVLGLGAGTIWRVFEGASTLDIHYVGVEIDPAVIDLGRKYFELSPEDERHEVWSGLDARVALRIAHGSFQQIALDCYANQIEIPPHLCTREFFAELYQHLSPGGWLTANLGGFDFDDPVVAAVARTCASAFATPALIIRVPHARNFMLLARREGPLPWASERLDLPLAQSPINLGARLLPGFAQRVMPDEVGLLLSDDLCPVEELQLHSIREARARRNRGMKP